MAPKNEPPRLFVVIRHVQHRVPLLTMERQMTEYPLWVTRCGQRFAAVEWRNEFERLVHEPAESKCEECYGNGG